MASEHFATRQLQGMSWRNFEGIEKEQQKKLIDACGSVESARCYWDRYVLPTIDDAERAGMRLGAHVGSAPEGRFGRDLERHMTRVHKAACELLGLLDDDTTQRLKLPPKPVSFSDVNDTGRVTRNQQRVQVLRKLLDELKHEIYVPHERTDGKTENLVCWGYEVDKSGCKVYKKKPDNRRLDAFLAWTADAFAKLNSPLDKTLPTKLLGIVFEILDMRSSSGRDAEHLRAVDAIRGAVTRGLIASAANGKKKIKRTSKT